jgi:hypothetical protein
MHSNAFMKRQQMKRTILWGVCSSLLIMGCSSNQYKNNANVKAIEDEKRSVASQNVNLSAHNPKFQVVMNKDDRILNICFIGQACEDINDLNNEVVVFSSSGMGLADYGNSKYCGDRLIGYDYNNNKRACHSKFFNVSDRFIPSRVITGLFTFGITTLVMWSSHERAFDRASLTDTAYQASLPDLQKLLFAKLSDSKSRGAISVVYIDTDDIDIAYRKIINKSVDGESVVLIDEATKRPLYVLKFSDYTDKELPIAVNLQLADFMASLSGRSVSSTSTTDLDVKRLIPPEVPVPALPAVPQLTKSEYETKAAFNGRVESAVAEREDAIRKLQQQYRRNVNNRNQYIEALGESWQQYLDGKASEQNELVKKLRKNQNSLARLLYAMNLGKISASDMSYDAESKNLYFTVTSERFGFMQKILANVSASSAKSIKEARQYKLTPEFVIKGDNIQLKEIILSETTRGDDFATRYTDVNFKPDFVSVKVATNSNKINKETSAIFKSYEQKPQAIVDANSKEVWYIDTVNRMNSKMPDWFAAPDQTNKVVGYGVGNSHEEAMHSARKELAYTVRTSISASTEILQKDNTFRSYSDVTQRVSAVTEVALNAGDYSVYKQIELDGKYYVALCYRCSAK